MDAHERRAERAQTITIRKARLGAQDERLDREFWAQLQTEIRGERSIRLALVVGNLEGRRHLPAIALRAAV